MTGTGEFREDPCGATGGHQDVSWRWSTLCPGPASKDKHARDVQMFFWEHRLAPPPTLGVLGHHPGGVYTQQTQGLAPKVTLDPMVSAQYWT